MNTNAISWHSKPNCGAIAPSAARFQAPWPVLAAILSASLAIGAVPALASSLDVDLPGGSDHPVLSRYQGSILAMHGGQNLAKVQIMDLQKGAAVYRDIEGRVSNRFYYAPRGRSVLEIWRNYQQALTAAGFQTMLACDTEACDKMGVQNKIKDFPRKAAWVAQSQYATNTYNSANQPYFHFISAKKQTPQGLLYVQIGLVGTSMEAPELGRVRQFIQVVEPATLEGGKVTVDMKGIQQGLQRDGKIALYGVHFDTNKAIVRDDSAEQLGQMAAALKAQPALKVFIVGHTDGQGDFEANLALSQKRAQAVAEALSTKHGIAAARLTARGVASLSPVSTNASEDGRAKNRRVELVVR